MSKNNITDRFKKGGTTLEVLAKPGTMKPYREGKMKMDQVLVAEEIFSNASKFQKAKSSDLKKGCGTDNKAECLKLILDQGDFPLSKKEMNEMVQNKRNEIVNYIHKYYHDHLVSLLNLYHFSIFHSFRRWCCFLHWSFIRFHFFDFNLLIFFLRIFHNL